MNRTIITFAFCTLLLSCGFDKSRTSEDDYQKAETTLNSITDKLDNSSSITNDSLMRQLVEEDKGLVFDYDENDVTDDNADKYAKLHDDIEKTHSKVKEFINNNAENIKIIKVHAPGILLSSSVVYPVYLKKDETMCFDLEMENPSSVSIYNADSQTRLVSYKKKTELHESYTAKYSAIYLVDIEPREKTYGSVDIYVKSKDIESILRPKEIKTETENVKQSAFMAKAIDGIKMQNLFENPRKFTLRGRLKSAFSGSSRAIVAIQVPKGAKDILYSLRISTSETPESDDGEFKKNMDTSYHKIKLLGLPVYESSRSIGLINTMLGENVPPRDEDAYINMYVFYLPLQARKFQNNLPTTKLKYSLDYSTVGTQSCDGRIPTKGYNTIYLGFENERMRYNNYVWLEAVSSVPVTEYVRTKYSVNE